VGQHSLKAENYDSHTLAHPFLMEFEGSRLLKKYGLPVVEGELAADKKEAVEIAERIGYPLVLKGMSRQIVHKTEAGIVMLNVQNEIELSRMFDEITINAHRYNPNTEMAGVLVQRMVPKGIELIIGIKKDPIFGHQLVIGTGGIFVEIVKDFAMKMMPVTEDEVDEMVRSLKGYPLLNGYRGGQKINLDLLKQMVKGLNDLVRDRPEIEEMDLNPVIFFNDISTICDVRILLGDPEPIISSPSRPLDNIEKMINPQSIAVVGASTNEKKNGGRLFRYIVENGYSGKLYPINPNADVIKGYKAYPSLKAVPGEVDLACIIVAAEHVPAVLEECIEKEIKTAIIYSSGFAEIGEEGKRLQDKICALAVKGNIRILGPNSIGIASPSKNIYTAFGAALEAENKISGSIGFVSQSGAMGSALLSRAWEQGAGFSRWVSVANEADLTTSDFINVLAEDELTKVITVFMEGIKNIDAFKNATKKALAHQKPVLVFKTGKSAVGKRAVQSHTGSIAGDDAVYSAAFQKMGVLRVNHIEELIDVSRAFSVQPLPKGNRIGVITASGGACSVIADLCAEYGLEIPTLTETSEAIKPLIPPFGSSQNPVDVTAEVISKPEMFKKVIQTLAGDQNVDGVIVMLTTNADPGAVVIAQAILEVFKEQNKPIVVGRLGADMIAPKAMAFYQLEDFPTYPTPERAVRVMSYLVKYNEVLNRTVH
jgi:acyl-CoA synthetase (NDP forming)